MAFDQLIGLLEARPGAELFSPAGLDAVRAMTRPLPADVATYFGFETRLGSAETPPDFAFSLSTPGLRWMAGQSNHWPRLAATCALWGASGTPPWSDGAALWLEFDRAMLTTPGREPSVFFALLDPRGVIGNSAGGRSQEWLCRTLLPAIRGQALSPAFEHNLRLCLARLPAGLDRLQIGVMSRANVEGARVCAFGLAADAVPSLLRQLEWPGPLETATALLGRYADCADTWCVHLDVGAAVYPTLGLELIYRAVDPWDWQPPREPRWQRLLQRLQEDHLCRPEKRDALLAWPGRRLCPAPLVDQLIWAAGTADEPGSPVLPGGELITGLQHVKLALDSRGRLEAKGYFGARYETGRPAAA